MLFLSSHSVVRVVFEQTKGIVKITAYRYNKGKGKFKKRYELTHPNSCMVVYFLKWYLGECDTVLRIQDVSWKPIELYLRISLLLHIEWFLFAYCWIPGQKYAMSCDLTLSLVKPCPCHNFKSMAMLKVRNMGTTILMLTRCSSGGWTSYLLQVEWYFDSRNLNEFTVFILGSKWLFQVGLFQ